MLKETKIKYNETIYDIAYRVYGGFENAFTLLQLNTWVTSVDMDLTPYVADVMAYDDVYKNKNVVGLTLQDKQKTGTITRPYYEQQSIYDACIEAYGTYDLMLQMVQQNNINNLNAVNASFNNIIFAKSNISDNAVLNNINKYNIRYATLSTSTNINGILTEDGFEILLENSQPIYAE